MVVFDIVQLLERIEPLREISSELGCIIVSQGSIIKMELVFTIIGEVCYFLLHRQRVPRFIILSTDTLGLLIAALEPANLPNGRTSNSLMASST